MACLIHPLRFDASVGLRLKRAVETQRVASRSSAASRSACSYPLFDIDQPPTGARPHFEPLRELLKLLQPRDSSSAHLDDVHHVLNLQQLFFWVHAVPSAACAPLGGFALVGSPSRSPFRSSVCFIDFQPLIASRLLASDAHPALARLASLARPNALSCTRTRYPHGLGAQPEHTPLLNGSTNALAAAAPH